MRKVIKGITIGVFALALGFLGIKFGPVIYSYITGKADITWESTRLTEELQKADELVVQKWEVTGEETITKEVNFVIFTSTTQKLKIPYTFTLEFKVDLSRARVSVEDGIIIVRVPSPYGANPKLTVDESKVSKSDFFDPVTNQQYSDYKQQIEQKLFEEGCAKPENVEAAWANTVENIMALYRNVVSNTGELAEVKVIRDDMLESAEPEATATANPE